MSVASFSQPVPAASTNAEHDQVRVRKLGATTVLVAVTGDVDAASAPAVFGRVQSLLTGFHQLVLDLSGVAFFGTAGYSLLHRLDTLATHAARDWVVVGGPEVQRLLRVCDPDRRFPVASNIVSAVATLARGPHRTPQLIAHR